MSEPGFSPYCIDPLFDTHQSLIQYLSCDPSHHKPDSSLEIPLSVNGFTTQTDGQLMQKSIFFSPTHQPPHPQPNLPMSPAFASSKIYLKLTHFSPYLLLPTHANIGHCSLTCVTAIISQSPFFLALLPNSCSHNSQSGPFNT